MAALTTAQLRPAIIAFDFKAICNDLGWNTRSLPSIEPIHTLADTYQLQCIAEKQGRLILLCELPQVPPRFECGAIDRAVTTLYSNHIIIYIDKNRSHQLWFYPKKVLGENGEIRTRYIYHIFTSGQTGETLAQRLIDLSIDFEREETEGITGSDVDALLSKAFDVDKVTKKFFEKYKEEHHLFTTTIIGIPDADSRSWYASIMLNRLIFTYFIQKKGFLAGDVHYLASRLTAHAGVNGNSFFTYYQQFLLKFFHEGLGKAPAQRSSDIQKLLGNVPYLNGGLFEPHHLEQAYAADLDIPDAAFTHLFNFLDSYTWYIDTRPTHDEKEIHPDVLGYIFEKFINQKQMGAYYTKEDITEYISKNTIIPFLFDRAAQLCPVAFTSTAAVWKLLHDDPDRYIFAPVRHGVDDPLPPTIAAGITNVAMRGEWNRPAQVPFALPTETWREHVARRQRCHEIRAKLANREVTQINDLITLNLDIIRLARDVVQNCEGADLLKAFYQAVTQITVLDPTCGSGAFLFAGLNILAPLYEACLDRMESFVEEDDARVEREGGHQHFMGPCDFRTILTQAAQHPSRNYFIYKSVIVQNLYGVDIMEDATEIAKLRLFLKLVAQVDTADRIEPLPDIDFNIRTGNTLVGYATYDEIKAAVIGRLGNGNYDNTIMTAIEVDMAELSHLFTHFRDQQTTFGGSITPTDKLALNQKMLALNDKLDRYLAWECNVNDADPAAFSQWKTSHAPLHWYAQFHSIMREGGFDVIIGNPPYVEYTLKKAGYSMKEMAVTKTANLYAYVTERSTVICNKQSKLGLIVQLSSISTKNMLPLQQLLLRKSSSIYVSSFSDRPQQLFVDAGIALTIFILQFSNINSEKGSHVFSTGLNRWNEKARQTLFDCITYCDTQYTINLSNNHFYLPKFQSENDVTIAKKMLYQLPLSHVKRPINGHNNIYYRTAGGRYWKVVLTQPFGHTSSSNKSATFASEVSPSSLTAIFASSLFWWYYTISFDMYNFKDYIIFDFRFSYTLAEKSILDELSRLGEMLMNDYSIKAVQKTVFINSKESNVTYKEYRPRLSKSIIDEIDRVLAKHYGFTEEELDFIINYDIKYRMGADDSDDGNGTG